MKSKSQIALLKSKCEVDIINSLKKLEDETKLSIKSCKAYTALNPVCVGKKYILDGFEIKLS